MHSEKFKKIAVIVFIHVIEIIILYFIGRWMWATTPEPYRVWGLAAVAVLYVAYFIVGTINDYRYVKYHIPEPPM